MKTAREIWEFYKARTDADDQWVTVDKAEMDAALLDDARERAEKALREFGQHHCNCNQAEVNSGCTCGFERVLASLKSSEGAK